MIRERSHQTCNSLPGSSLLSSLPLRSHQKAPLRGLALLILISQTRPTHPHTHITPAPPHLPRSPPLLRRVVWDTLAEEDTGGQERDPGEVVRWRIRCSPPAASAPPTHPNLLISTQRCLSHIAPGNGYSQTVTLCPQMDPPPISPSHIPPPGGWAPLIQREEGKAYV